MRSRIITTILLGVGLFFFTVAAVKLYQHYKEEQSIREYLRDHNIVSGQRLDYELALRVSSLIRDDFETDPSKWGSFDRVSVPFLRTSAGDLLEIKEGLCGEGARVNVRLLQSVGFDATRIALRTSKLGNSGHAAVSVLLDREEFFVDTINSAQWFNNLVNSQAINTSCYSIPSYSSRMKLESYHVKESDAGCRELVEQLPLYDYQGIPYTKFANVLGLDVYILNRARPWKWVSYLAESVYLIQAIFFIFIGVLVVVIAGLVKVRSHKVNSQCVG